MSRVFLISDLHFGHQGILRFTTRRHYCQSVEEHDALLIKNWNQTVSKDDTVYVLGDVAWNREAALACLPQLQGQKFLVGGNHDSWQWLRYDFDKFFGAREYRGCVFTHIPVHPQELYTPTRRWEFNFHGHTHDSHVLNAHDCPDPNYVNVCCEQVGMTPIPFEDVLALARKRRDNPCFEKPTPWR